MSATRKPSAVYDGISVQTAANFFVGNSKRWQLHTGNPPAVVEELDWECVSPFGSVRNVIVVDENGQPVFDRPEYRESPNVNVVVWGMEPDGTVRLAVVSQPRPHADNPFLEPGAACDPVTFGQIVMGFNKRKVLGDDAVDQYESVEDTAARETAEESGAKVIRNIEVPHVPWHNPNPTFCATWSDLLFVEVDLDALEEFRSTRNEPIFKAEFVTVRELLRRIAEGRGPNGELYRMCTANSAWMIFFATHPELLIY
ncbi:MAG: NUDIX domain-containing protein [Patescibacteria group bacterium]